MPVPVLAFPAAAAALGRHAPSRAPRAPGGAVRPAAAPLSLRSSPGTGRRGALAFAVKGGKGAADEEEYEVVEEVVYVTDDETAEQEGDEDTVVVVEVRA